MKKYKILINKQTYKKAENYLNSLKNNMALAGRYLFLALKTKNISSLSLQDFVEILINTKRTQIFAESEVCGDGSDWNQVELSILGDISIFLPVLVYDNALHYSPKVYTTPFKANLIYTPGALLRNESGNIPVDWTEVVIKGKIDFNSYYLLYERRFLPVFEHINTMSKDKKAFITIPGMGCGQFAGKFQGSLGDLFKKVLIKFLNKYKAEFSNIKAVYYDPYSECNNESLEIANISFLVRPLTKNNENKAQLCKPIEYEEKGYDFSNYELFSIVAWDHVSWPGNDFYINSRVTDDGVKAAATNSMHIITGIKGSYNSETNKYLAPKEYKNWGDLVIKHQLSLSF